MGYSRGAASAAASSAGGHWAASSLIRAADSAAGRPWPTATPSRYAVSGAAGRATPCATSRARSRTSADVESGRVQAQLGAGRPRPVVQPAHRIAS